MDIFFHAVLGRFWMKKRRWVAVFFGFFLLAVIRMADAGEFDLSEIMPTEVVSIHGTNMKAGMFRYVYPGTFRGRPSEELTEKAGIIVNDEVIYYVSVEGREESGVDPGGDCNFGVYKDYFLMDCFSFGASHNRLMYLFRFKGKKVELLDFIREAYVGKEGDSADLDFMSVSNGKRREMPSTPIWTKVQDVDNDGNAEVKIRILPNGTPELYLEIKDDRIRVDFNPALYKPLFVRERSKKQKKKTDAYYIYGFLAGKLKLEDVVAMLKSADAEQRGRVIALLKNRDVWDAAFHNDYGEKPVLMKKYIKKRR